jgi:hypothetical protein
LVGHEKTYLIKVIKNRPCGNAGAVFFMGAWWCCGAFGIKEKSPNLGASLYIKSNSY